MSEVSEEDRKTLVHVLEEHDREADEEGDIAPEIDFSCCADAVIAAGWRPVGVPAVDREKLAEAIFTADPFPEALSDWAHASAQMRSHVRSVADDIISAGVLRSQADVKAEALEEAAREFAPEAKDPAPGFVRGIDQVRDWLRARAAVLRGDGSAT